MSRVALTARKGERRGDSFLHFLKIRSVAEACQCSCETKQERGGNAAMGPDETSPLLGPQTGRGTCPVPRYGAGIQKPRPRPPHPDTNPLRLRLRVPYPLSMKTQPAAPTPGRSPCPCVPCRSLPVLSGPADSYGSVCDSYDSFSILQKTFVFVADSIPSSYNSIGENEWSSDTIVFLNRIAAATPAVKTNRTRRDARHRSSANRGQGAGSQESGLRQRPSPSPSGGRSRTTWARKGPRRPTLDSPKTAFVLSFRN